METAAVHSSSKRLLFVLVPICLLLFGTSFVASFRYFRSNPSAKIALPIVNQSNNKDTATGPACPINGLHYTANQATQWQDNRPLGVMIENSSAARPQSGLNKADVVYEAVAEGGITRFLAVFLCDGSQADVTVGPVRSARTFFLDWISEYDGLYAHVGGANTAGPADALGQIIRYGIHDINQFNYDYPTFWRDKTRLAQGYALEHTMYSSTQKLWDLANNKLGWGATDEKTNKRWDDTFQQWYFIDDPAKAASASASKVTIPFWGKTADDYTVVWSYDPQAKIYKRENGGTAHIDAISAQQLTTKNIVIQFMEENHANDGYPGNQHLLYGTIGSGDAWIIQDGTLVKGTWKKHDRTSRTKYYDLSGNEIGLVRGKIWIETVPTYDKSSVVIK